MRVLMTILDNCRSVGMKMQALLWWGAVSDRDSDHVLGSYAVFERFLRLASWIEPTFTRTTKV